MTATHTIIESPIGDLTLVAKDGTLGGVYFPGHWYPPAPSALGARSDSGFEPVQEQLGEYLAGERRDFELATAAEGDAFQQRVWQLIDAIPYGETTTYGEIALALGGDASLARAVGGAVGRNPLSLIVPCHRVIGKDGKLTGYAGGLERKRFLLELEGALGVSELATSRLF
jgi:methylated-DNA-[protein]-cysteine S-methyltransferase